MEKPESLKFRLKNIDNETLRKKKEDVELKI